MKRKVILLVSALLCVVMMISACGTKTPKTEDLATDAGAEVTTEAAKATTEAAVDPTAEHVTLKYYIVGPFPLKDQDEVFAKANEIIEKEINATVEFIGIGWNDFPTKINIIQSSGEDYDLVFTSNWMNDFLVNTSKGYYLPLDDLVQQYAPQTYASMPETFWKAPKVNGQIYGVPNYQIVARNTNMFLNKELADKFAFDADSVKKLEDLEPYFEQVKGLNDQYTANSVLFRDLNYYYNLEFVSTIQSVGAVEISSDAKKVSNMFESDAFKSYYKLMSDWSTKGYIQSDLTTQPQNIDPSGEFYKKYTSVTFGGTWAPDTEINESQKKFPLYARPLSENWVTTGTIDATLTAISATSKNPERAMMYIELVNTNKELYNLLCYGIEGKHYTVVDAENDIIELTADSGYQPWFNWEVGNSFNAHILKGNSPDLFAQMKEMNDTANTSPLLGFAYNGDAIVTELAQCGAVVTEYEPIFTNGLMDDAMYSEFMDKLKAAGSEAVVADMQKQVDAFFAAQ